MSKVKVFTTKIEDDYEIYPEALFAILEDKEVSERERKSPDGIRDYTHKTAIATLEYTASYWLSVSAHAAGKKSRPILNNDDTLSFGERLVLSVDLGHEESERIMRGDLEPMEVSNELIKHDIIRRISL